LTRWLESSEYPNKLLTHRLYFSYYFGSGHDDEHWHEYGVSIKENVKTDDSNMTVKILGEGKYACMDTKAYGSLTGVLEMMHRWIVCDQNYLIDDERQWFAEYEIPTHPTNEVDTRVICYIPVIPII
jgi:AraC family transcriptional regulator